MLEKSPFEKLLATPEPPELGPGPRAGVKPELDLNHDLEIIFQHTGPSHERRQLIRALVLLWHDHLDAAHTIAQSIDNADGALVHAIMHRREPDYGNAAYWFRRVGRHPAFVEMARRSSAFLASNPDASLGQKLLPGGAWDPVAFLALCEQAGSAQAPADRQKLLREIQRLETESLLDWFCS